ncbi:hypothetical protein [Okeania sp. KiyG1]|nr:hypothetical protein [Okeania sp. KiyG1]
MKKEEGRRKKEEGRRKKEEGSSGVTRLKWCNSRGGFSVKLTVLQIIL